MHTYTTHRHTSFYILSSCRSQRPRGLRCGPAAALLLGLWVRIQPKGVGVSCGCCVLSGRGLCVGLITRPEESYRAWCVWVWSWSLDNNETLAHKGLLRHWEKGEIVWLTRRSVSFVADKLDTSKQISLKIAPSTNKNFTFFVSPQYRKIFHLWVVRLYDV